MNFEKKLVFLGKEVKESKKGNSYTVYSLLDENGVTHRALGNESIAGTYLERFVEYTAYLKLTLGKYSRLELTNIK